MNDLQDDHRGHTIFTHASGPPGGPFYESWSAWRIEPNNNCVGITQGSLNHLFSTESDAMEGAGGAARGAINNLLDAPK